MKKEIIEEIIRLVQKYYITDLKIENCYTYYDVNLQIPFEDVEKE